MATKNAIITVIQVLKANGVQSSPSGEAALTIVVRTWERVLAEVSDDDLEAAVFGHLADPDQCRWWPQPGIILDRARRIAGERYDREVAGELDRRRGTLRLVQRDA